MTEEKMEEIQKDVEKGKGGFIPFSEVNSDMIIYLKQNNYSIEAVRDQDIYWYKPNRPGAAKENAENADSENAKAAQAG